MTDSLQHNAAADGTASALGDLEASLGQLIAQTEIWLRSGVDQKLFASTESDTNLASQAHSARDLFSDQPRRPLVVGLFGGTGVGKSTLLNRLAGEQIARTGVERPTSREVTVFLHNDYALDALPDDFPIQKVNIRQHTQAAQRDVMWIDMPDIDSVEQENLHMVQAWLPFVDVVLYVVNPSRYRDARGWQYLRDQGHQHAWLFIVNQWDQITGQAGSEDAVLADFHALLARADFADPMVFRTDCVTGEDDDFAKLQGQLARYSDAHQIEEIEARGLGRRAQQVQRLIEAQLEKLGTDSMLDQLDQSLEKDWSLMTAQLTHHLDRHFQQMASQYIRPHRSLKARLLQQAESSSMRLAQDENAHAIWDQRATLAMQDVLNKLQQQADQLGLPAKPVAERLQPLTLVIADQMPVAIQNQLRIALAKPGTWWQRVAYKTSQFLSVILPIAALGWIAWRVVSVYYSAESAQYFGLNFALHSGMLVLLAWGVPAFLKAQCQPSMQIAALRGMQAGLAEGLSDTQAEIAQSLGAVRQQIENYRETGQQLHEALSNCLPQEVSEKHPQLDALWQKQKANQAHAD